LQDYEYFWQLSQKTGGKQAADELVNIIVYKRPFGRNAMLDIEIWKNNPEKWDQVRSKSTQRKCHRFHAEFAQRSCNCSNSLRSDLDC